MNEPAGNGIINVYIYRTKSMGIGGIIMLSCLPVSLFPDFFTGRTTVGEWARFAASIGLDAFDISILFVRDRTPQGLAAFRKDAESGGIPLAMLTTYPDFTAPDPVTYEKELVRALSDISVAADLEARYVRLTAGQVYPDEDLNRQLDQVCRAFEVCADHADKWGIRLLWENHSKPMAWEREDFNYGEERLDAMLERLRGSRVRMNYDIANAWLVGKDLAFLRSCYPEIASIHINDAAGREPIVFTGIGDGKADVRGSLATLRKMGYTGLYSIEEASGQGWDGIRKYVEVTRGILSGN